MSLTSREFFEGMEDGTEYISALITEEYYNLIPPEVQSIMVINEVKKTNIDFKTDPIHKDLLVKVMKSKKKLTEYEYNLNKKK